MKTLIKVIIILSLIIQETPALDFISIGTGAVTGVYYPIGGALARLVNKKLNEYQIKATVESTGGSVYNINAILSGDLDFGFSQADKQYQAYNGLMEWANTGPQKKLRAVFALHNEAITLVSSEKSGIKSINDLKGKRVNLGNPGSGQLQNAKDILSAIGLSENSVKAEYIKPLEAPTLLQDERLDAFFFTVGHPNANVQEAASGRIKIMIVPIEGSPIDNLIKKYPFYTKTAIPASYYPGILNKKYIPTIAVKALIDTSASVSERKVYVLTKEIFENLESLKKLHPALSHLTKEDMVKNIDIPIHNGALKYYKEAGLDKYIK